MKKFFLSFFVLISVFIFVACEVGMGSALDLEAPEITITSPLDGDNVHKTITLEGTCRDNLRVTEIDVSERAQDGTMICRGKGVIHGERWSCDISLEEGDRFIICTVKDAAGNSSPRSKAVLTLIVDETSPTDKGWYIIRGKNISVNFMSRSKLESVDCDLATNKYIPQNEGFSINGHFEDAISVASATVNLYEDDFSTPFISKTVTAASITSGSIYAPQWDFTHDELVSKKSSLNSGKHYIKVAYEVADEAGNKSRSDVGYLLWYPESDIPGIQQSATENEKLLVNAGSAIPVHFFDDDELKEVAYAFISEEEKINNNLSYENMNTYLLDGTHNVTIAQGESEYPLQISTTKDDGKAFSSGIYFILAYVKDINENEKRRFIEVNLMDASKPMLIITSPLENERPSVVAGAGGVASVFKFIGNSYDTSGSKCVKIAYIPEYGTYKTAADKQKRAKDIFENESLAANGEIVKTYTFPSDKPRPDPENNMIMEPFEFSFDLLTDFPTEMNKSKFFLIRLEDIDKNIVDKQMIVSADDDKPEIEIASPKNDMMVVDYSSQSLLLKFKAVKASGLGIKPESYCVKRIPSGNNQNDKDFECTFANGKLSWDDPVKKEYVTVSIDKSTLTKWACGFEGYSVDPQPIFEFIAADILGNEGMNRRTVVLSPLPVLESVSIDQAGNKTYPLGTVISFQAKFSDTVKVTGTPKLKLSGLSKDGSSYTTYADYVREENNSDTIKFTYTVESGVTASEISCSGDSIVLEPGTKIVTGTQGTGDAIIKFVDGNNFWDSADPDVRRKVGLDGILPVINSIKLNSISGVSPKTDGKYYASANRDVLIDVEFSEPVVISGNVYLKTTAAGVVNFKQYSMSTDKKTITYSYKVALKDQDIGNLIETFNNVELTCDTTGCFELDSTKSIKDEAGNNLNLSNTVSNNLKTVFDTIKPNKPIVPVIEIENETSHQFVNKGTCNKPPRYEVNINSDTDIEKLEISIDNGQSWIDYTKKTAPSASDSWVWGTDSYDSGKLKIKDGGTYHVIARATDKAGNVSDNTDAIDVQYNDQFPEILDIKIANENGSYSKGKTLKFQIFLADTVKEFTEDSASITFETINSVTGSVGKRTVKVRAPVLKDGKYVDPEDDTKEFNFAILEFDHTISDEKSGTQKIDVYKGIRISAVDLNGLQDKYDNKQTAVTTAKINSLTAVPSDASKETGCYRPSINADGFVPEISAKIPVDNGICTGKDSEGNFMITLTFDEEVSKESGNIILQRKGAWGIPAVMTVTDFNRVYNSSSLTSADKEKLMVTQNGNGTGNEELDSRTGIAIGPYKKITHGLKFADIHGYEKEISSKNVYLPDTDTKYVLDFNLGLFSGETKLDPHGKNVTAKVSDIRAVFEKAGYHRHTLQMNSSYIKQDSSNKKVWYVSFPKNEFYNADYDSNGDSIPDGIEWELIIEPGTFRDSVGNLYGGISSGEYTLWSDKAAAPVVRVDRYSHGWGAIEPKSSATVYSDATKTNFQEITENTIRGGTVAGNSGGKLEPTGYARVRIDSQTPGAVIDYTVINKGAFDATTGKVATGSSAANISWMKYTLSSGINVKDGNTGTSTSSSAGNYKTGLSNQNCSLSYIEDLDSLPSSITQTNSSNGIIFVVGDGDYKTARKDYVVAVARKTPLTTSGMGYEGVFKTVIYSENFNNSNSQLCIEGGTFMGGEPSVSGFPVRDVALPSFSKNCYKSGDKQFIWNSYEIVSTKWSILLYGGTNSQNYPYSSYGQATYVNDYFHY
ncbi:MAG: hypothetical protein KBT21_04950 [Treponema sp.]|nr:hypothetical protein [Candidatus Treponema merdequi]